jgi:tetratricopeptide (TPR) repeat protein
MRRIFLFLLLLLSFALPGAALAQDAWQQGRQAYERGDFATAARHFTTAVKAGNARAALSLGYMHDSGLGVARDGALAQELYIMAVTKGGMTMAGNNLAYLWARQNGLLEQALCLSAQTLEEEPDNAYYLDTYGFILLMKNEPALAGAYFRKAIRIIPDYSDALEHLGDVAAMTGKGDAAGYWRRAASNPRDERQQARIAAKLGGAKPPGDLNAHPPFKLRDPGLPSECGIPSV